MENIRIIFFDIDGTLVDPAICDIPQSTKEALLRLHEKGFLLFIATGRPPACLPDFTGVPFDGFITLNGSLGYTPERTLFHNPIPAESVRRVIRNAAALGRPVTIATRDRMATNGYDEDLAQYHRLAGQELTVAPDFEALCRENIYQIMLGCREADHPAIIRGAEGADITFSWPRAADVTPKGSGKAEAIRKVLALYQLDASQAMAFGDGCNDMEMLRTVGTGVAMGNADPRVKKIANVVCGHVAEDGIFHFCLDHGLI